MKITDEVYLVGSGRLGLRLSHDSDCHVYVVDSGGVLGMVDAGVGMEPERILNNVRADGLDPKRIGHIFITHAHCDHMGGASWMAEQTGAMVYMSAAKAHILEKGDEEESGLEAARAAGFYPKEYHLNPARVDVKFEDGDEFKVGYLLLRAIRTPGHEEDHMCFLMQGRERRYFFASDHVSFGGLISLQNFPQAKSSLKEYRENIHKLAKLGVDVFLPGHGLFTVSKGQDELDLAIEALGDLFVKGRFFLPSRVY